jgi:protein-S-isoprenylcysteine O-methyltransferase Ste14
MGNLKVGERVRHLLEAVFTVLLFGTQTILNAGIAISIMAIPLLPYLFYLLTGANNYPEALKTQIWAMFYLDTFIVGRLIAVVGATVLLVAAVQLLWCHIKGVEVIKTGAYSVVRHPQFTGIIIITFGLTVMVLTNSTSSLFQTAGLWLIQVLGYIALARYEEWRLLKKYGDDFYQYKQKVPFLLPIKSPLRIPETLFTIIIATIIFAVLLFLPYDLIRIYSSKLSANYSITCMR